MKESLGSLWRHPKAILHLFLQNQKLIHQSSLYQAYPNPFNPKTNFDLIIPDREKVKIFIIDILGREVRILKNSILNPGEYRLSWDGTDKFGRLVSSGTYFVVSDYSGIRQMQKLLFLK